MACAWTEGLRSTRDFQCCFQHWGSNLSTCFTQNHLHRLDHQSQAVQKSVSVGNWPQLLYLGQYSGGAHGWNGDYIRDEEEQSGITWRLNPHVWAHPALAGGILPLRHTYCLALFERCVLPPVGLCTSAQKRTSRGNANETPNLSCRDDFWPFMLLLKCLALAAIKPTETFWSDVNCLFSPFPRPLSSMHNYHNPFKCLNIKN